MTVAGGTGGKSSVSHHIPLPVIIILASSTKPVQNKMFSVNLSGYYYELRKGILSWEKAATQCANPIAHLKCILELPLSIFRNKLLLSLSCRITLFIVHDWKSRQHYILACCTWDKCTDVYFVEAYAMTLCMVTSLTSKSNLTLKINNVSTTYGASFDVCHICGWQPTIQHCLHGLIYQPSCLSEV